MTFSTFRRALGAAHCADAWRLLGAGIADDAYISTSVTMTHPTHVTIGSGCKLAGTVSLSSWESISFATNVLVNSASIYTADHDIDSPFLDGREQPVTIGDYVWIIHEVVILPGVTVGHHAVLATRAVVTKDVGAYEVVAGNPAKQIGERDASIEYVYVPSGVWRPEGHEARAREL